MWLPTNQAETVAITALPLRVYFLGIVEFDRLRSLQGLLHEEVCAGGPATLILCEHPPTVTVGRQGSHGHFDLDGWERWRGPCPVRWVNRAGGCWLHWPGQLAIYALLPLGRLFPAAQAHCSNGNHCQPSGAANSAARSRGGGVPPEQWQAADGTGWGKTLTWTGEASDGSHGGAGMAAGPSEFVSRLRRMLREVLADYQLERRLRAADLAWWASGRPIACWGAAVRDGTTSYGAILNINPPLDWFRRVRTGPGHPAMTSLEREAHRPIRAALVRQRVVEHFCRLFGFSGPSAIMGHPFLKRKASEHAFVAAR